MSLATISSTLPNSTVLTPETYAKDLGAVVSFRRFNTAAKFQDILNAAAFCLLLDKQGYSYTLNATTVSYSMPSRILGLAG